MDESSLGRASGPGAVQAYEQPRPSQELDEAQYARLRQAGILYLIRHRIRPPAAREDLVHEALIRALEGFDPSHGASFFHFFVHVVLHRLMLNHVRNCGARATLALHEDTAAAPDGRAAAEGRRMARALDDFRESLPAPRRLVFDVAILLLGSLGTSSTKQGLPHNFASKGAALTGQTRYLFLKAWEELAQGLRLVLRAEGLEPDD